MVRQPLSARERMLARLVKHVRAHGLPADTSLRRFADELGTSHRMLAYYFGSRDELLATVLTAMRSAERQAAVSAAESWSLRDAALAMWSYYTDSARAGEHQAFFYVFALALREPETYDEFLASLDTWVTLTAELAVAQGGDPAEANVRSQLLVGAVRGLLMTRLTAREPADVDAAFTLLLDALFPETLASETVVPEPRRLRPARR